MRYKTVSYYMDKARSIQFSDSSKVKKIAILSNFTIQGLPEILKVICHEQNMNIDIYEAPYGQFKQEIINKNSGWHNFRPELTFIILDFDSLIGDIKFHFYSLDESHREHLINEICQEINNLLTSALDKKFGKIIISNFPVPTYTPFGIFDSKVKYTLRSFVNSLNEIIQNLALSNDSLYILEMDVFLQQFGKFNVLTEKLRFLADMKISPSFLPPFADFMISFMKPLFGKTRKCLVLDLDNTIWGGIIGEDGINGIQLDNKAPGNSFLEFQKTVLELYNRGIILAINSKNNLEDVREVFVKHPYMILKENHFASMYINWDDKVTNMIRISNDLNIGLDSMVYLDDDPVNRELVRQKLPEIMVVELTKDPATYSQILQNLNDFNSFHITKEDLEKGKMYAAQLQRKATVTQFSDMKDFLNSLEMEVTANEGNEFTLPRIAQLTMKTNQFNLTTRRYSEEQIKMMLNNSNFLVKTFSVKDKFGDNGLTGLYIIKKEGIERWVIDTFLMSCRIMGRDIEKIMISDLIDEAKRSNINEIIGEFISTKKNEVTKNLFSNCGFTQINDSLFILKDISKINNNSIPHIRKI